MIATPLAWTHTSDFINFAVADSKYSFNRSVRTLAKSMKKVSLLIKAQILEDILETNFGCGHTARRYVDVILVESRIRVVGTGQQRSKRVDNCRLSNVVGPDKDVEAR